MSDSIQVSVILPTLNRAGVLERSIRSVLEQTLADIELIVVDDGSTDDTRGVIESFEDRRIQYVRHDRPLGPSAARNAGLHRARGRYVAFQDSDDVWLPPKLHKQVEALQRASGNARVCVCSLRQHKQGRTYPVVYETEVFPGNVVVDRLLGGMNIGTQTILAEREVLSAIDGFDVSLPVSEDWELCLRLALDHGFAFLGDVLVELHYSKDSLTGDPHKFAEATERIVTKHHGLFEQCPSGLSTRMYEAGKYFAFAGEHGESLSYVRRAIEASPSNWRAHLLRLSVLTRTVSLLKAFRR